ncbi:hypothetical protein SUGI_1517990 [Cryptomeria japonica]|nr:hypothetical protein SUGI_1517990 [Cryptomeria japonica]
MWRRNFMANTLMMLFLLTTILYNIQSADARRILRHKHSAKVVHSKEEHPQIKKSVDDAGLELNIQLGQRLSGSNHNPAVGHTQLTRPHQKMNTLKNKLPSGPSPGVRNAYINDGGVKRSGSILKTKLPSGPSPGTGH